MPLPVTLISGAPAVQVSVEELSAPADELLAKIAFAVCEPTAPAGGVQDTATVMDPLGPTVVPGPGAVSPNQPLGSVSVAELITRSASPLFETVILLLPVVPTLTMPNATSVTFMIGSVPAP